jgi:murein DD-endopeptidase MepM/ murein hydrolase activator NlpD
MPDFRTAAPPPEAIPAANKKIQFADKTDLFDWPVDDARLTRGFLPNRRHPHWGLDLASKRGTPILASQGGTVIYTGREFRGYGNMVIIESNGGWATLYAHMDKILVQEGQKISQGEIIGAMGRTGRATGVHLHFEIRKDRGPIDPLPMLPNGGKVASYLKDRHSQSRN